MEREDVLKSPEYWTAKTQIELYHCADEFMKSTKLNRTELSEYLGVSKGYVSQLLNGDYDHRMSKFFELALAFGYVPKVEFVPLAKYIEVDKQTNSFRLSIANIPNVSKWSGTVKTHSQKDNLNFSCETTAWKSPKDAA